MDEQEHKEQEHKEYIGGFVPVLKAEGDATLREAGSLAVVAGGDANIKEGGAGLCVVGGDLNMSQAGAGNMIIGGSVEMSESGVGQMATMEANVADSRVGFQLAANANLERSEVMLTTQQAAALGAVAGIVFFLLSRLFKR